MHRLTHRAAVAAVAGLAAAVLIALLLVEAGPAAASNDQIYYPSPSPITTVMPTTVVVTTPTPVTPMATATTPATMTATATATTPTATATSTPTSTPTAAPTTPPAAPSASILVAANTTFGPILTDGSSGHTLYTFAADTAGSGTSACYTTCATNWPPLLTSGTPARPSGLTGQLGVITRTDGTQQVTLNGRPLYLFKFDKNAGDVIGEGINAFGGVWSVATASGMVPTPPKPATTPAAPSTGSGVATSHPDSLVGLSLAAALLLIVSGSAGLAMVRRRR